MEGSIRGKGKPLTEIQNGTRNTAGMVSENERPFLDLLAELLVELVIDEK